MSSVSFLEPLYSFNRAFGLSEMQASFHLNQRLCFIHLTRSLTCCKRKLFINNVLGIEGKSVPLPIV